MRKLSTLVPVAMLLLVATASARPPRFGYRPATTSYRPATVHSNASTWNPVPMQSVPTTVSFAAASAPVGAPQAGAQEALHEVNAARAARGLPPYQYDPGLTQAAMTVASTRAASLNAGHTANDFAGLPSGVTASASGCAAWPASMGWGSCATYDRYTYAGAAWAPGRDGRRYMQLFVR